MLTFSDQEGVLGTVTLENGTLTGSTPSMQQMAGTALKHQGSPEAAFQYLAGLPSNGYVWVSRRADQ